MTAGVVGSLASASDLVVSVVSASHTEPYDTRDETQIDDSDGHPFAQVQSAVNGPKTVDDDRSTINQGVAIPIGYDDSSKWDSIPKGAENLTVEFGVTSVPGDFDAQNIDIRKQGSSSTSYSQWLSYAIDIAWESTVGWFVPIPSPDDLLLDDDNTSLSRPSDYEGFEATYHGLGESYEGAGVEWEIDFYAHNGSTPTGTWDFYTICSGDVGYYNVGGGESGFNKVGDFWHYHDVEVTVEDLD